jgi:excisionase family DNA binding protein
MTDQTVTPGTLLQVGYVARIPNISRRTVAQLAEDGALRSVKIGRLRRYRREDLEAFVNERVSGGTEDKR